MKVKVESPVVDLFLPPFLPIKTERCCFPKLGGETSFRCLELLDDVPTKRPVVKAPEIIECYVNSKIKLKHERREKKKKIGKLNNLRPSKHEYRVIEIPKTKGKKPKVSKRWQLLCSHCDTLFFARPTPKNSRYVVNHQCKNDRRRQYIIGIKARNCKQPHTCACIQHVECYNNTRGYSSQTVHSYANSGNGPARRKIKESFKRFEEVVF